MGKKRLTKEEFIEKAKQVHGDRYDYLKVNYVNWKTKVCIICPEHGEFWQIPNNHLNKKGCPKCADIQRNNFKRSNLESFIKKSKIVHNNFYIYDKSIYKGCFDLIEIICPNHGIFWQTPSNHLKGEGCPFCRKSKGELKIESWLKNKNIIFISQKSFDNCRGKKRLLIFDFYLPEYNICIEYDGEQHFKPFRFKNQIKSLELFKKLKINDEIKNKYCKNNNIKLIRISYKNFNKIDKILKNELEK